MGRTLKLETLVRRKLQRARDRLDRIEREVRQKFLPISRGGDPQSATASVILPTQCRYRKTATYYCSTLDGPRLLHRLRRAKSLAKGRYEAVRPFSELRSERQVAIRKAKAQAQACIARQRTAQLTEELTCLGVPTCTHPLPEALYACRFCSRHLCRECYSWASCSRCDCSDLCIDCRVTAYGSSYTETLCPDCAGQTGGTVVLISCEDAIRLLSPVTAQDEADESILLSKSAWSRKLGRGVLIKDGETPASYRADGVKLWRLDQIELYESDSEAEQAHQEALAALEVLRFRVKRGE